MIATTAIFNILHECANDDNISTTKQSTMKPYTYFIGYTVAMDVWNILPLNVFPLLAPTQFPLMRVLSKEKVLERRCVDAIVGNMCLLVTRNPSRQVTRNCNDTRCKVISEFICNYN